MITHKTKVFARGLSILLGLILSSMLAFAQSDNTQISGFVKDQTGAVIANAKVSVKNETTNYERSATTNGDGYYIVTQLPSGRYTVSVEANGFKLYRESNTKLDPNVPAKLDV